MSIPIECCITSDKGKQTKVGKLLETSETKKTTLPSKFYEHVLLALYLLEKRADKKHFLAPYFRILPQNKECYPIFWNSSTLNLLQGSSIQLSIEGMEDLLKNEYKILGETSPEFKSGLSLEDYMFVRNLISSRVFRLKIHGREVRVLGPYADMMDHGEIRRAEWKYDDSLDALTVTALDAMEVGDEVTCHYGRKSAKQFLLWYGFTPIETLVSGKFSHLRNVEFVMFVPPDVPDAKAKQDLVNSTYSTKKYSIDSDFTIGNACETLSFLRLLNAEGPEELALLPKMTEDYCLIRTPIHPISIENEIRMLEMLLNMMQGQHSHYLEYAKSEFDPGGGQNRGRSCKRQKVAHPDEHESAGPSASECSKVKVSDAAIEESAKRIIWGEVMLCRFYMNLIDQVIPALERMVTTPYFTMLGLDEPATEYIAYVWCSLKRQQESDSSDRNNAPP
eukprot:CAMPEP_0197517794 /NCGR_PEP_ID=MMETSP1318-20131121/2873_1 /TAXON_ID=552666 /ORGANISM="Partenskyella glossopodia, Strain RCC365" /LENGTH=448 /DNA_ID=CAMNT_0043067643 /DNA_START=296 /DNA_END=1642 /DNA_ORIENTATION=-